MGLMWTSGTTLPETAKVWGSQATLACGMFDIYGLVD